ncbi:MAG TPA: 4a-hydroxytetrahydrobiopterin dehydratase [Candidatus Limnocylindrales bacterium]|nr:4a-hydroxytetrahydrobiopterin dehydratase [Candidatus Limnocylindrales bacterium]
MGLLSEDEIRAALTDLEGWSGDAHGLGRTAELPSFPDAIKVVDQVAVVAEELDHHPDIDIRWRTLTFACSTHSEGGVTSKDVELAQRINSIIAAA